MAGLGELGDLNVWVAWLVADRARSVVGAARGAWRERLRRVWRLRRASPCRGGGPGCVGEGSGSGQAAGSALIVFSARR